MSAAYYRCPAGICFARFTFDPDHETPLPEIPASSDIAHDALVEHLIAVHEVPREQAGRLASNAPRVPERGATRTTSQGGTHD
ncbi:MAG: hypothetical protein HOW97_34065 [Catenulispora sp.]|nr:hypothetical protein [Catenulispora sp.]